MNFIPQPRCYGDWHIVEEKKENKKTKPRYIFKKGDKPCTR